MTQVDSIMMGFSKFKSERKTMHFTEANQIILIRCKLCILCTSIECFIASFTKDKPLNNFSPYLAYNKTMCYACNTKPWIFHIKMGPELELLEIRLSFLRTFN